MSIFNFQITVPDDCEHYLESSARLRGTSRTNLLRHVVLAVLRDHLIMSVLDDDNKLLPGGRTRKTKLFA